MSLNKIDKDYRVHIYQVPCPLFCVPYSIESILKIDSIVLQSYTNTRLRRFLPKMIQYLLYCMNKITKIHALKQQRKCLSISSNKDGCVIENLRPGSWGLPCIFLVRIFSICSIFSGILKNHFRKTQQFFGSKLISFQLSCYTDSTNFAPISFVWSGYLRTATCWSTCSRRSLPATVMTYS